MSDLDHLTISRILGSTVKPYSRVGFGGFAAARAVGEMLAARPKRPGRLSPEPTRDKKIVQAFRKAHHGYSLDRVLADPQLSEEFIRQVHALGVNEPAPLINRRLLRIRKAGDLDVDTTVEETRDLEPYLIPAELAFALLGYQHEASYDDLLVDPDLGAAFDAIALKIGHGGAAVDYRLAALHLRKNIRSRSGDERRKLAEVGATELTKQWRPVGPVAKVSFDDVPDDEGIFAIAEPSRFLYLTRYPHMRTGVASFRDPKVLAALGNKFWTPSPENISVQVIKKPAAGATSLRLLELKALEMYRPIFNLLPAA